jgi:hypothetical protein
MTPDKPKNWVRCSITFYFSKDTYITDWDEFTPSDDIILKRCKEYMIEDITSLDDPIQLRDIVAEFVDPPTSIITMLNT